MRECAMRMRTRWVLGCSWVLLFCSLLPAAETALQPPTWPQDFSAVPGEGATFGVPNPGAGPIKVTVTWTGGPLTIGATGSNGKVLVPPADRSSPSHSFTIDAQTVGNPANCPLVIVALQLPKGVAGNAKATGKITVASQAIDPARFREQMQPFLAKQAARPTELTPAQSAGQLKAAQAVADAKNKAAETEKVARTKSLQTQAKTESAAHANALKSMASPANRFKLARAPIMPGALKGAVKGGRIAPSKSPSPTPVTPMLRGINPQAGLAGEQVMLAAVGLSPDATEIHFTLAPNVTVQANILSFETQGDGSAMIKVQVPEKAGLTSPFAGQVVAKALDRTPVVTTNAVAFQFTPVVAPSIVYLDPVEVQPGDGVQLQGNNFVQGDVVHVIIPGLGDYAALDTTVRDTTHLGARLPLYSSKEIAAGWIYITRKVPTGWVSSQNAPLTFNPSLPLIQSLPDSAEADSPILIGGVSFGGPRGEAAASSTPGATGEQAKAGGSSGQTGTGIGQAQSGGGTGGGMPSGSAVYLIDASGKEYKLQVSSWTDTHIVTRTPALGGFVNPQGCKLYVKNNAGKSDPKPLSLAPSRTIVLMLLTDIMMTNDYVFRNQDTNGVFALVPNPAAGMWLNGYHTAKWFGRKNDDEYFLKRKLRNGWVVDSIDFSGDNSRLDGSRVGTDSPYVKVHWWSDGPWQTARYTVKIYVKGPTGTMY